MIEANSRKSWQVQTT